MPWWSIDREEPEPVPLVLYTRRDCGLCEEMKQVIARARLSRAWRLEEVDIDGDPSLVAAYGKSIPVLEIAGRVAFKGRMDRGSFERKFERRLRAAEVDSRRAKDMESGRE